MTDSDFDPYRDWLGLRSPPSNYYELLGLPVGETDVERIRSAATRAMSVLRSIKPGSRRGRWKTLLDQLQAAHQCLLNQDAKAQYDERLRRSRDAGAPNANERLEPPAVSTWLPPEVDPMAPVHFVSASPSAPARIAGSAPTPAPASARWPSSDELHVPTVVPPARRARRAGRKRAASPAPVASPKLAYSLGAICFLGVLGSFIGVVQWRIMPALENRQRQMTTIPQSANDLPLPDDEWVTLDKGGESKAATQTPPDADVSAQPPMVDRAPAKREVVLPANRSAQPPAPVTPPVATLPTEVTLPPETVEQVDGLLRDAYAALHERRWDAAENALDRAQSLADSTTHAPRVERFVTLADYARQYYQAYEDGLKDLAGSELMLEGQQAFVVEVNDNAMVIRMEGVNRRFPSDSPPTELMMAIADRWFDQRAATTQVFRGAFMLVTPSFTAEDVRVIWQSAERSGAPLGDLSQILGDLADLEERKRPH